MLSLPQQQPALTLTSAVLTAASSGTPIVALSGSLSAGTAVTMAAVSTTATPLPGSMARQPVVKVINNVYFTYVCKIFIPECLWY